MKDLSLVMGVKIDSKQRQANLDLVVAHFQYHFPEIEIILVENDNVPRLKNRYDCSYHFLPYAGYFDRQSAVSLGIERSQRRFVALHDADVVLSKEATVEGLDLVEKHLWVYPYDGRFYNVLRDLHDRIKETKEVDWIDVKDCRLMHPQSVGGSIFFDRKTLIKGGSVNKRIKGNGYDDNELYARFRILGYRPERVQRPLFHLDHPRLDTAFENNKDAGSNQRELYRIARMSKEQIEKEIGGSSPKNLLL